MSNEDQINPPSSSSSSSSSSSIFTDSPPFITHPCFPPQAAGSSGVFPSSHPPTHHRSKRRRVLRIGGDPGASSSGSKQKSSKKPQHNAPLITHPCTECGRKFWSWKALFGHMRCHPERQWRGIRPPPNLLRGGPRVAAVHTEEDHEVAACLLMLASGSPPRTSVELEDGEIPADSGALLVGARDAAAAASNCQQFECSGCKKVFGSHQALGGHRASHKNIKGCFAITRHDDGGGEGDVQRVDDDGGGEAGLGHRCGICAKAFQSGQALGGHMRCHWEKGEGTSSQQGVGNNPSALGEQQQQRVVFDLNLPPPVEGEGEGDGNSSSSSSSTSLSLDLNLGI